MKNMIRRLLENNPWDDDAEEAYADDISVDPYTGALTLVGHVQGWTANNQGGMSDMELSILSQAFAAFEEKVKELDRHSTAVISEAAMRERA